MTSHRIKWVTVGEAGLTLTFNFIDQDVTLGLKNQFLYLVSYLEIKLFFLNFPKKN